MDAHHYKAIYQELLLLLKDYRHQIAGELDKILAKLDQLKFDVLPIKLLEEDQTYFSNSLSA